MKSYPNIEKSVFHKGEYIGYQNGAWRIQKSTSSYGRWWAVHEQYPRFQIFAWSLDHMSRRLAETTVII